MKLALLLIIALLCLSAVAAQTYYVEPEESLAITTTCIKNNVLGALNATIIIYHENSTNVTPVVNMTHVGTGVYTINVTFINPGTYFTKETCTFAGGVTGEGSDTIIVKPVITASLIIIVASFLLVWLLLHRRGYRLLAAGLFVAIALTPFVIYHDSIDKTILALPLIIAIIYLFYQINETLFQGRAWV